MDASTLLEQYTQDLSNLPAELAHLLEELREYDLKFYDTRKRIQQRDAQLHKYIKQHGSLVKHPKEDLIYSKIKEDFETAKKLQEEKTVLANTALFLISKHLVRLERDIERLENDGVIPKMEIKEEDELEEQALAAQTALSQKMSILNSQISQTSISESSSNKKQPPKKSRQGTPSSHNSAAGLTPSSSNLGINGIGSDIAAGGSLPRRKIKTEDLDDTDGYSSGGGSGGIRTNNRNSALLEHGASGTVTIPMKNHGPGGSGNGGNNGNEEDELYCFCQQVSYGNMIACDNDNCKFEWFHYDCVGLKEPPQGIWYCPDCTKEMELNSSHKRKEKKRK